MANRSYSITTAGLSNFLAYLIKGGSNSMYFALGIGENVWDTGELPNPQPNMTGLVNEVYRVPIDNSKTVFVDPGNYETVVDEVSTVIRLEINITKESYPGVLREYGVFAIDATDTLGSGTLIQYSDFDVQTVPSDAGLKFWVYLSL